MRLFTAIYFLAALSVLFFSSEEAQAYLDPGTGSILLQGLLAAVAGALVTLKLYWYRIKSFFTRRTSQEEGSAPDNEKFDDTNDTGAGR